MEGRSIFISSLSRRELARRRPSRSPVPTHVLIALVLIALAIAAVFVVRGGV